MTIKEFMQKLAEAIIDQDIPEDAEIAYIDIGMLDDADVHYDDRTNTVSMAS